MTLLDAKQYDAMRDRRMRNWIFVAVIVILIVAWTAYHLRDYRERSHVAQFFSALQQKNFGAAYGIWFNDPDWQKHPNKFKDYSYSDFNRDWGLGGEWGIINNYSIDCSLSQGNGVIVQATVNHRLEPANVWVDKNDHTLSFSPTEIQCGNWWGWLVE
jgi:hypothetical protein